MICSMRSHQQLEVLELARERRATIVNVSSETTQFLDRTFISALKSHYREKLRKLLIILVKSLSGNAYLRSAKGGMAPLPLTTNDQPSTALKNSIASPQVVLGAFSTKTHTPDRRRKLLSLRMLTSSSYKRQLKESIERSDKAQCGRERSHAHGSSLARKEQNRCNVNADTDEDSLSSKSVKASSTPVSIISVPSTNQMYKRIIVDNYDFEALIDTGSHLNLIREYIYQKLHSADLLESTLTFTGFGQHTVNTTGFFAASIKIDDDDFPTIIHVVPRESMTAEEIVRQELLNQANLMIDKDGIKITKRSNDSLLHIQSVEEELNIEKTATSESKDKVKELIENYSPTKMITMKNEPAIPNSVIEFYYKDGKFDRKATVQKFSKLNVLQSRIYRVMDYVDHPSKKLNKQKPGQKKSVTTSALTSKVDRLFLKQPNLTVRAAAEKLKIITRNKKKSDEGTFSEDQMKEAVKQVVEKSKSVRGVAKDTGLSFQTLARYVKKIPRPEGQHEVHSELWKEAVCKTLRLVSRATVFNKRNVNTFFDTLNTAMMRNPSFGDGSRVFNLDETGTGTVLSPKRLVTACNIIRARGHAFPPAMVFPRDYFKEHMLRGAPRSTTGLTNPSGWTNSSLFVLLLDVAVCSPFKAHYNNSVDQWMKDHQGTPMSIYDVSGCFGVAFERAMTPTNILASSRRTGIVPFDPHVFTDTDFLPKLYLMSATAEGSSTNKELKKLDENTDFISPKEFIGHPKAKSRKENPNKTREVVSCILTGTLQKEDLERREKEKKSKKIKKPKLDLNLSSSSSEELKPEMSDYESSGGELCPSPSSPAMDLVISENQNEFCVLFRRRSNKISNSFIYLTVEDESTVMKADITMILSEPVAAAKTKRHGRFITLEINFDKNVL
ncbi:hypothetical protein ILUMI_10628 [Ignelater luminosus]|uniref:Peptidase A2 domain-containing protein n=1 Tax=Ignelater luminosus TaxID=2038154 RepID=A0A8K0D215_IGNLU|nr:hypothetical protein ILUMI_10628 [Ignelater luminosus]